MSDFAVGDRVRLTHYPELGAGTVADVSDTFGVKWDSGAQGYFLNENIGNELTRIEEPQPWQGECFKCHQPLPPGEAYIWATSTSISKETHGVSYECETHWRESVERSAAIRHMKDAEALARSRAWMHERHPDDPRWQEAE